MPFALVIMGLIFVVTGVKGTIGALGSQLKDDFTGPGNFFYWFAAIGSIGALGSIQEFRAFSRMFMTLILVAMIIKNGGVFDKLMQAIASGPVAPERDTKSTGSEKGSTLLGSIVPGASIGNAGVRAVQALASQSIATSQSQQSSPAQNAGALAKVLGFFF
jgi:hypothetical protein